MPENMYYRKWSGHDPLVARDAIIDHLGGVLPSLIDTAESWPTVQASRTENFDAFVTDEVLMGLIKWLHALADATENESVSELLHSHAATIESELVERGLVEV